LSNQNEVEIMSVRLFVMAWVVNNTYRASVCFARKAFFHPIKGNASTARIMTAYDRLMSLGLQCHKMMEMKLIPDQTCFLGSIEAP
jgi:hypothetical protein